MPFDSSVSASWLRLRSLPLGPLLPLASCSVPRPPPSRGCHGCHASYEADLLHGTHASYEADLLHGTRASYKADLSHGTRVSYDADLLQGISTAVLISACCVAAPAAVMSMSTSSQ